MSDNIPANTNSQSETTLRKPVSFRILGINTYFRMAHSPRGKMYQKVTSKHLVAVGEKTLMQISPEALVLSVLLDESPGKKLRYRLRRLPKTLGQNVNLSPTAKNYLECAGFIVGALGLAGTLVMIVCAPTILAGIAEDHPVQMVQHFVMAGR
ncbi:hypothetical protein [Acetobacter sp. LMG 32666]|uniref:hypothetical protein n=1 Tax=Acetobacter sp. LMG 32666 TaxID=2959295 RepID=UPI0030C7D877